MRTLLAWIVRHASRPGFLLLLVCGPVSAQDRTSIQWRTLENHVEIVRDGKYLTPRGPIEFLALRFHLGYVRLRLIDTGEAVNTGLDVSSGIGRSIVAGKQVAEILNYNLENVAKRLGPETIAAVPAGWSRTQRNLEHVGLLRINGRLIHEMSDKPSMSAILCLHDAVQFPDHEGPVPVVFAMKAAASVNPRAQKCPNAVQGGPRIVEEGAQPGITEGELRTTRYQRVIFAVDNPNRPPGNPKSRDAARNGYIIVVTNAVHLYDVQSMLLDPQFYGDKNYGPHWAVNLAGANHTGLMLNSRSGPELIENTQTIIGSVLALERSP